MSTVSPKLSERVVEWSHEAIVLYFEPVQRTVRVCQAFTTEPPAKQNLRIVFAMILFVIGSVMYRGLTGLDLFHSSSHYSIVLEAVVMIVWPLLGYRLGGRWFESRSGAHDVEARPRDH
jgi:hypothetical protein